MWLALLDDLAAEAAWITFRGTNVLVELDDGSALLRIEELKVEPGVDLERSLARHLGALVGLQGDPRGVFVFEVAITSCTYDEIVEEVGARGRWLGGRQRENTLAGHASADLEEARLHLESMRDANGALTEEGLAELVLRSVERAHAEQSAPPSPSEEDLVLLVKRRSTLTVRVDPADDVHHVAELTDGLLIRTIWPHSSSRDEAEVLLAECYVTWLEEHDDSRGVPCFRAEHLSHVSRSSSYEEALAHLGEATSFLVPRPLASEGSSSLLARLGLDLAKPSG